MNPAYVTVADAAHLVRRSHRTIREWVRRGIIDTRHEDGVLHVSWVDVMAADERAGRRVRLPKSQRCG